MFRLGLATLIVVALVGIFSTTAVAAPVGCVQTGQNTKEVIPGVTLTWDSSFRCAGVPNSGSYGVTVRVTNAATSVQAVNINTILLSHATPRPRRGSAAGSVTASSLPLTIAPGETLTFTVSGDYTLATPGRARLANLHLRAAGEGVTSVEPFRLGVNIHIRGDR